MDCVRFGVVGIGNMGSVHAKFLFEGAIKNAKLTALCDLEEKKLKWAKSVFGDDVKYFDNYTEMLQSGVIDAVMIAVPHYDHPAFTIEAFKNNIHVVCEKPAGVYTKAVREMNEAAQKSASVFSLMYNQRTNPAYNVTKRLIEDGKIGEAKRLVWIITDWYRTQGYYDSGSWRATWRGEGGGVLINQCPHNLDLWQWLFGKPNKISATCSVGKYHNIEVEDDVTIFAKYENGATATFITTTGDSPGTNRLEITGDKGKIVVEGGIVKYWELTVPERIYCFNETEYEMGTRYHEIVPEPTKNGHNIILQNFTNAILKGEKLIAPGIEGIHGLEISNAAYLSSWIDSEISLPIDEELFYEELQKRVNNSKVKAEHVSNTANLGIYSDRWEVK